jgi:hypothetical protein
VIRHIFLCCNISFDPNVLENISVAIKHTREHETPNLKVMAQTAQTVPQTAQTVEKGL